MRTHLKRSTRRWLHPLGIVAIMFATLLGVSVPSVEAAAGDVVMMGDRDALMATPLVVWGNTKHPNGSAFTLDFGDMTPPLVGVVADQTYIAAQHPYAAAGIYTATLTVAGDSDTVIIEVFNGALLTPANLRSLRINMAIEDGLRNLYFNQDNRQGTYNTKFTTWERFTHGNPAFYLSYTSLVVLAFENHGHTAIDNPTQDIYQPVVQRGLNTLFNEMSRFTLTVELAGDPCVGVPAGPDQCVGLGLNPTNFHSGYASSVMTLAVAGSGSPARTVDAGIGVNNAGFVAGRTYGEILQRQSNAVVWGMSDGLGAQRGGFDYTLDSNIRGDGSAAGWGVLALLDAQAAGATVPAFVPPEVEIYATAGVNADGGLKYQSTGGVGSNFPKTGISLQVQLIAGRPVGHARVQGAINLLATNWAAGF